MPYLKIYWRLPSMFAVSVILTCFLSVGQAFAGTAKNYDFSSLYELDGINPPNSTPAQNSINHSRFQDDPADLPAVQDVIQNLSAIKSEFTPESINAVHGGVRGGGEKNFNDQKNLLQPPRQIPRVNNRSDLTG